MSLFRAITGLSVLLTTAAAAMTFLPVAGARPQQDAAPNEPSFEPIILAALADRFDFSALPKPRPPEPVAAPPTPPPDPAAGLRRYRLIGLAVSDARAAGVFERDGAATVLAAGSNLEGFALARIDANGALFQNDDDIEFTLPLELMRDP